MITEQQIAQILRDAKPRDHRRLAGWVKICEQFARRLQLNNDCFDALRFLELSGAHE